MHCVFLCLDYVTQEAAKILRLLHIRELRELQTLANEAIIAVQSLTANPKTDTKLGKVGIWRCTVFQRFCVKLSIVDMQNVAQCFVLLMFSFVFYCQSLLAVAEMHHTLSTVDDTLLDLMKVSYQ